VNELLIIIGSFLLGLSGGSSLFLSFRPEEEVARRLAVKKEIDPPTAFDRVKKRRNKLRWCFVVLWIAGAVLTTIGIIGLSCP